MLEKFDLCALSDRVNWELMPWKWESAPLEWIQAISMYIHARDEARQPRQPMSAEQLAPLVPSHAEAEAQLREMGML